MPLYKLRRPFFDGQVFHKEFAHFAEGTAPKGAVPVNAKTEQSELAFEPTTFADLTDTSRDTAGNLTSKGKAAK